MAHCYIVRINQIYVLYAVCLPCVHIRKQWIETVCVDLESICW